MKWMFLSIKRESRGNWMGTPKYYTIVSGKGYSRHALVAFDNALLDAGIGDYNLVKVSSILPIGCQYKENIDIEYGSIVYAAYSSVIVNDNVKRSTAVAVAVPLNDEENGVIFETTSDYDMAESNVYDMCIEAMKNRNRSVKEIKCSSTSICGEVGLYASGISAVVMW